MKKFKPQELVGVIQLDNQTFHGFYRVESVGARKMKIRCVDTGLRRVFSTTTGHESYSTLNGHGESRVVDCVEAVTKYRKFERRLPMVTVKLPS